MLRAVFCLLSVSLLLWASPGTAADAVTDRAADIASDTDAPDVAPDVAPNVAEDADAAYIDELVRAAEAKKLADTRFWHLLLHYRPGLFGRPVSDVDGRDFFLAKKGKRNPEAELAATLAAFFTPVPKEPGVQHPQCRFVARYHWLKEQIGFDPERLPERYCRRFNKWYGALDPDAVVLVFPSAYLNSPPSMFGHTFLRLDREDKPELLDYALNYSAHVPEGEGPLYAVKGLLGFFPGRFSILQYYVKVKEYGEIENRDLWEYRLNFTKPQMRWMLMHAWELGPTYFRYFFLRENCSFHLLSLLEVADPNMDLTGPFDHWTLPTDTLRVMMDQPGAVTDITFRPARSTMIQHRQNHMKKDQVRLARRIARGKLDPTGDVLSIYPEADKADILELAHNYLLYLDAEREETEPDPELERLKHLVLVARSGVNAESPLGEVPTPEVAPHAGHGTQRLMLGGGERGGDPFVQLGYRAAIHDLLDPVPGYDPRAQLQAFSLDVRHYLDDDRTELTRATLMDILSLSPLDGFFRNRSWKMHLGWQGRRAGECAACGAANFNFGTGIALGTDDSGVLGYLFGELDSNYGTRFLREHAVGPGFSTGLLLGRGAVRMHVNGSVTRYVGGQQFTERRGRAEGRLAVGRRAALRVSAQVVEVADIRTREFQAGLHLYW